MLRSLELRALNSRLDGQKNAVQTALGAKYLRYVDVKAACNSTSFMHNESIHPQPTLYPPARASACFFFGVLMLSSCACAKQQTCRRNLREIPQSPDFPHEQQGTTKSDAGTEPMSELHVSLGKQHARPDPRGSFEVRDGDHLQLLQQTR